MTIRKKGITHKGGLLPEKVRNTFEALQAELNIIFTNKNLLYQQIKKTFFKNKVDIVAYIAFA